MGDDCPVITMTITLLIADDHQLFRQGLRQLCEVNGGFVVLAETARRFVTGQLG